MAISDFPSSEQGIIAPGGLLDRLESRALALHEKAIAAQGQALGWAIEAGEVLLEIKRRKLVAHGQWTAFYERICGSKQTASVYIALASNRALLEGNVQSSGRLSIAEALRRIRNLRSKRKEEGEAAPEGKSILVSAWGKASDSERTAVLATLDVERLLELMPPDLRLQLETRFARQLKARDRKPSKPAKNSFKPKIAAGREHAPPTPAPEPEKVALDPAPESPAERTYLGRRVLEDKTIFH